ncbi:hypothetical protein RDI58_024641 [Solanum bulbocastanum]|uniref:Uncharacterized protein n=1 Tax=Solanum bulbocastanum TaxID=147425 RepID=A0AAN8T5B3_SOLBU
MTATKVQPTLPPKPPDDYDNHVEIDLKLDVTAQSKHTHVSKEALNTPAAKAKPPKCQQSLWLL